MLITSPQSSAVRADPAWTSEAVTDANRRYYALTAEAYEQHESCLVEAAPQERLRADLAELATRIQPAGRRPRALDACGGTGNATLKLLELGFDVVNVDVSPEMHRILEAKLEGNRHPGRCRLVASAVRSFLAQNAEPFDLIVFSSALHHMADYAEVLEACFDELSEPGWLYTNFDPTERAQLPTWARAALQLDYWLYKIFVRFDELPASVKRWTLRHLRGNRAEGELREESLGVLAEFHARRGIDDLALAARLEQRGVVVSHHGRTAQARLQRFERWLSARGAATEFSLWLHRASRIRGDEKD